MSVRVTRLANGVRVATDSMAGVESVTVGVWVGVGARHERASSHGVAHFLEHMAFKGTRRRSAEAIAREIEDVGGDLNAWTSRELTAYYARVLADDAPLALDMLSDILANSVLEPGEFERERGVILQEIGRSMDTPDDLVFDDMQDAAFPAQAMGRPILGSRERIATLRRESLARFIGEHYAPSRMVVAAAGRVEHEAFAGLAEKHFTSWRKGTSPSLPKPAAYAGGGRLRRKRDAEQAHAVYALRACSYGDPLYYPLLVFSQALGGGMASRLFQEIREKRGLAYSVFSFASAYADDGLLGIYVGCDGARLHEILHVCRQELCALGEAIGEEELARAKAVLRAGLLMSLESSGARCDRLAQHLLMHGRHLSVAEVLERVEAIDRRAVGEVFERLARSSPTLAVVGSVPRGFEVEAEREAGISL